MQFLRRASAVLLLAGTPPASAFSATYYVSNNGNDANSGTSPEEAWKSIGRVSAFTFVSGDRILFQGGPNFEGTIRLAADHPNSAGLEIGAYGQGRARVQAGRESGVLVRDWEKLTIKNLIVEGEGSTTNKGFGVYVENTRGDRRLNDLDIDSVEVSGFGQHGLLITGKTYGYANVRVERCSMHDNLKGGLEVAGRLPWDAKTYAHQNVTVTECRAFDNPGDPNYTRNHSGSGLVLYQVDGGRIEKCAAWNNGGFCPARGGGPVGIWTCASRRVTIEYCESFGNRTQGLDGGGFDIDGGSEDCVLQYNYSHDNKGPGLMVYTYPYASFQDREMCRVE